MRTIRSIHPYPPFIPDGATKLIIGSIPPPRFCIKILILNSEDVNFYYGSKDNYFWPLMSEITNRRLRYENSEKAIIERKTLLTDLRIGITDIISSCILRDGSASDENLDKIEFKDLSGLLKSHEKIDTLFYTSEFIKSLVYRSTNAYHTPNKSDKRMLSIKINGKFYKVIQLYSPSPTALRGIGKGGEEKRKNQYRKFLLAEQQA